MYVCVCVGGGGGVAKLKYKTPHEGGEGGG